MNRTITVAKADDWIGVYINGELQDEGHSMSAAQILEILGIEHETVEVDEEWIEEEGNLPTNLSEIVKAKP